MNTIKDCIKIIITGDKIESRLAAREVGKLVYNSRDKDKYTSIVDIVSSAPDTYVAILEDWRQENFVMAISIMYFLHGRDKHPDFLFPWLLQLLLHDRGNIRYAAVKMIYNELGPLSYYIRFPKNQKKEDLLTPQESDNVLRSLFMSLQNLMPKTWKASYKRYKYIHSLPTSPYKSIQMVFSEMEELCGAVYMRELENTAQWYQTVN